jgi:hypothetical protein
VAERLRALLEEVMPGLDCIMLDVTMADVGLSSQPAAAPPLEVARGHAHAIEGFTGTGVPVEQSG